MIYFKNNVYKHGLNTLAIHSISRRILTAVSLDTFSTSLYCLCTKKTKMKCFLLWSSVTKLYDMITSSWNFLHRDNTEVFKNCPKSPRYPKSPWLTVLKICQFCDQILKYHFIDQCMDKQCKTKDKTRLLFFCVCVCVCVCFCFFFFFFLSFF